MIQGGRKADYPLPECITDSDCRLTLHTNCRNTREIALHLGHPAADLKNPPGFGAHRQLLGEPVRPTLHLLPSQSQQVAALNRVLDTLSAQKLRNVTILTPPDLRLHRPAPHLTEDPHNSSIRLYSYRGKSYMVTTCIRFKGLESDAIILMDLSLRTFSGRGSLAFYVGSSRAKYRLDLICTLPEPEYGALVSQLDPGSPTAGRTPDQLRADLGSLFSATVETR